MMDKKNDISVLRWNAFQQFISARVAQVSAADTDEPRSDRPDREDGSQPELVGGLYHANDKKRATAQRAK